MQEPRAKKSLGQNFLQDKNIARKIVDLLCITHDDNVLEIGPGPGMLTQFIVEARPASLTLIEKDNHMAKVWEEQVADIAVPTLVFGIDALAVEWSKYKHPVKIISNLPYNVASPLVWDIVSKASGLQRAVFMVQKEVGERMVATAGSSAYGALSIWVQNFTAAKMEFTVPPQVFKPRPKVQSAVVSFTPIKKEQRSSRPDILSFILKMFFQQRRKQLGSILRSHGYSIKALEELGIKPELRPENLSVSQYRALSEVFLVESDA